MGASKCSQGDINSNCATEQSFCTINGQKVSQNPEIEANLSIITQNQTLVDDTLWNHIYNILTNIFNYGKRGTRNPLIRKDATNDIITIASERKDNFKDQIEYKDITLEQLYNDIIDIIPVNGLNNILSNYSVITKEVMDRLQFQINNYQLNSDRCNSCNTACNTSCQASCQCSGEGNQGGGGGDCGIGTQYYFYYGCGGQGNPCGISSGDNCGSWYAQG